MQGINVFFITAMHRGWANAATEWRETEEWAEPDYYWLNIRYAYMHMHIYAKRINSSFQLSIRSSDLLIRCANMIICHMHFNTFKSIG